MAREQSLPPRERVRLLDDQSDGRDRGGRCQLRVGQIQRGIVRSSAGVLQVSSNRSSSRPRAPRSLILQFLSFREDYLTSQSFRTNEEKDNYYSELKTAAESGWDFSSRWFILDGTNKGNSSFSLPILDSVRANSKRCNNPVFRNVTRRDC